MERYLAKCLDSLMIDSYLLDKLEVLVINDGSKDKSSEIAHNYESAYPNTFVVIDKENGNYGSCINAALKVATGKYIKVLDADDSFDNQELAPFILYLESVSVDLVLSDCAVIDENDFPIDKYKFSLPSNILLDFSLYCGTKRLNWIPMHCVTYNIAIFQNLDYKQTEGISYTDIEWTFIPMTRVKTLYYYDKVIYRYLLGREGQTCSYLVQQKSIRQHVQVNMNRLTGFVKHKDFVSLTIKEYMIYNLSREFKYIYHMAILHDALPVSELIEMDKILKAVDEVYNSSHICNAKVSSKFPYKYIKAWRSNYKPTFILKLFKLIKKVF